MDVRAALEILGLEDGPDLTPDRVRRTYMRKLREHPPERDPDGFARLREAYEVARDIEIYRALGIDGFDRVDVPAEPRAVESIADVVPADTASDAATDDIDDWNAGPPTPADEFAHALGEILELLRDGHYDRAAQRERELRTSSTDDHRNVYQYLALRWMMVRELVAIAPALPDRVVPTLARAIASYDTDGANDALGDFARSHKQHVNDTLSVLRRRAPSLYSAFGLHLARPLGMRANFDPPPLVRLFLALVVLLVVAIVAQCFDEDREYKARPVAPDHVILATGSGDWDGLASQLDTISEERMFSRAEQVAARVAAKTARAHDCGELVNGLRVLEAASAAARTSPMPQILEVRDRFRAICMAPLVPGVAP